MSRQATAGGPVDGYLGRDVSAWRGFPAAGMDELAALYTFSEGEGRALRGERGIAYRYRALPREEFHSPFLFHFRAERLALIETDFWSLDGAQSRSCLAALGAPATRLDAYFRDSVVAEADWLYPDRGLALCVMPETGLIARWTAFAPCTAEVYRQELAGFSLSREFRPEH